MAPNDYGSLVAPINQQQPFTSFFMAGFECTTHRRSDGTRLDLLAATSHDRLTAYDYRLLRGSGITSARDGVRWHLIESSMGRYCWDSWLPMLRAARSGGIQVIWDLCHFGWPDHLDIWSPQFVDRFAKFAGAAAQVHCDEIGEPPLFCPINEISYLAWAGGEVGHINPGSVGRGPALKEQLVRASIAAVEAIRSVDPRSRIITSEPLIHVIAARGSSDSEAAEHCRLAQFEALDMLRGRTSAHLGGREEYLDVTGFNFYPDGQWFFNGSTIPWGHYAYRPLSEMLTEAFLRYRRPLLISETGAEGTARASWLHYVCSEVARASRGGVHTEGICLYPILDYPGWDDGRICPTGLFSMPGRSGQRTVDLDFMGELTRQGDRRPAGTRAPRRLDRTDRPDRPDRPQLRLS